MKQRCSIRAIAVAANVSVATVSRALKGFGNVTPETKARIQKLASEMGYEKDPHLAQMFAVMRERRRSSYKETLAFLTDMPEEVLDPLHWMGKFYEVLFLGPIRMATS